MSVRASWIVLLAGSLALAGCDKEGKDDEKVPEPAPIAQETPPRQAVKIDDPRLENAHRLTEKVITGAEPHGAASFQALKDLGVRTVISVDGSAPDLEEAHKYGLRYVHLPIGYDGVPKERSEELAKALLELPGPFYIHCHHGKHRGPAAAVTACVVSGQMNNDEAVAGMKVLGTGENYLGLWKSAREAQAVPQKELKNLKVKFRETAEIPPLAEAMVHMDHAFENLKDCKKAGWTTPKDHPDLDPPHEALRLREIWTEVMRTAEFSKRPDDFKAWSKDAENHARDLEDALRAWKKSGEAKPSEKVESAFKALQQNCNTCHASYRNVPRP
ncbi:MAG: cytochrome c [Planctomycetota bacterium]|nr:cytochrome c [Planctomycetota bacterium]